MLDILQLAATEIDGKQVNFSKNLAEALFYADLEAGDLIWADAICIDQANLYEKSYQIMRMGQIYSKAEHTVVWLGKEDCNTHYAVELMLDRRIKRVPASHVEDFSLEIPDIISHPREELESSLAADELAYQNALREHKFPARALHGLRSLLERPYWERVWIIQEIAKAKRIHVKSGRMTLDLRVLFIVSQRLMTYLSKRSLFSMPLQISMPRSSEDHLLTIG